MSEKDIQDIIIPPKYSLPTTISQTEPKFIDTTVQPLKSSSNTIIFSKTENMAQFVITAQSYVTAVEMGAEMSLDDIPNATTTTGDIAVEVTDIPLPETLKGRKNGLISNERGTIAWQGDNKIIITLIHSPSNPITGERLTPPNISEPIPQPQTSTAASFSPAENRPDKIIDFSQNDQARIQYIRPLTDDDLKKAA